MRNGKLIFSKAWGMADLEHNAQLTVESPTEAGSVSKQFTAASILLLEQQGKLSINDDIRKYIPELPNYGHPILIRHMLEHTSGLKDWGSVAELAGWPRSTKTYTNEEALLILSRQKTLNNIPGEEYIYSNSNFNVLATVVKRVSGMSLAEFSKKYIFEPAGMKHTQWRDDFKNVVPNRAMAYAYDSKNYKTNMPNEYVYGQGGLLTTAEDLVAWNEYYSSGKLGNPSLFTKQTTSYPFNNGRPHNYAAGLVITSNKGWKLISHSGATASYRANLEYYPELGLSIAWLSNTSRYDGAPFNVAQAVAELMIPAKVAKTAEVKPVPFAISAASMKSFAGWYRNNRSGDGLNLVAKGDQLLAYSTDTLIAQNDHSFKWGRSVFDWYGKDRKQLRQITGANDTIYFSPVASGAMDSAAWKIYLGDYASTEADAEYAVKMKDGKLNLFMQPDKWFELTPTYKDAFDFNLGTIYFTRDKTGKITGFKASVDRARNMEFKRL
jgi:CubicO group peptidase (beta-lactamase class C family)